MSEKFCSACGKPMHHHDHHDHMRHHDHDFKHRDKHHHHHHDDHSHDHFCEDCFCERFVRDDHFRVRLGGLAHGLNFRLRQLIGCIVRLKVDCGGDCKKILAEICYVGNNFIEVNILDKDGWDHDDDDYSYDDGGAVWRKDNDDRDRRKRKKRKKHHHRHHKFAVFPLRSIQWFELDDDCDCDHHHDCDCHC